MNEKKINKILILHFNFILEIPLKINDIKKISALQFYKRNPFKTEQTKKVKIVKFPKKGLYSRHVIWRSTFSMILKNRL